LAGNKGTLAFNKESLGTLEALALSEGTVACNKEAMATLVFSEETAFNKGSLAGNKGTLAFNKESLGTLEALALREGTVAGSCANGILDRGSLLVVGCACPFSLDTRTVAGRRHTPSRSGRDGHVGSTNPARQHCRAPGAGGLPEHDGRHGRGWCGQLDWPANWSCSSPERAT
jgi:hypothetical protein